MIENEALFSIADDIATKHIKPRWLERVPSLLARRIRLRTDIYRALIFARRCGHTPPSPSIEEPASPAGEGKLP